MTEDGQSMRLQAEKLQADTEENEKFVFGAWEPLKAAEEQRHSEAPHRHAEEAASAVLKSHNGAHREPDRGPPRRQQGVIGGQIQRGSGSVHPGGAAGSRACCRTTEDRCRAEFARGQCRGTHPVFGTEGERTAEESTPAAAEAAEENVNVEVQQLEKQEASAYEIESHKKAHGATLQEMNKAIRGIQMELSVQRFFVSDMRRQFPEHSAQLSSLGRDLHEIWCRSDGRSWKIQCRMDQPRNPAAAAGIVRKMPWSRGVNVKPLKVQEPQELKVVVDLEMQSSSVEKQPDLPSSGSMTRELTGGSVVTRSRDTV